MTPHKAIEAARTVADSLDKRFETYQFSNAMADVGWAEGWADGRESPKNGIVYANWNDPRVTTPVGRGEIKLMSRLGTVLEKMGVEIAWCDQVSTCSDCGLLIQTEPDSYSWQPEYVVGDGCITCAKCLQDGAVEYLESLEGNPHAANHVASIDPSEHGYVLLDADNEPTDETGQRETGWHPGQNDDPRTVAKGLEALGVTRYVFNVAEVSQFYSKWDVYVHVDEIDLLTAAATAKVTALKVPS
jgi:hypothetical protein